MHDGHDTCACTYECVCRVCSICHVLSPFLLPDGYKVWPFTCACDSCLALIPQSFAFEQLTPAQQARRQATYDRQQKSKTGKRVGRPRKQAVKVETAAGKEASSPQQHVVKQAASHHPVTAPAAQHNPQPMPQPSHSSPLAHVAHHIPQPLHQHVTQHLPRPIHPYIAQHAALQYQSAYSQVMVHATQPEAQAQHMAAYAAPLFPAHQSMVAPHHPVMEQPFAAHPLHPHHAMPAPRMIAPSHDLIYVE